MISVEKAKKIISEKINLLHSEKIEVVNSVDRILSADVIAKINIPSFDNSAMDGFALKHSDLENGKTDFLILEDIKAGDNTEITINPGECAPIFTGALIPNGTDTIIMVEKTTTENNIMKVEEGYQSQSGKHIRLLGEQIKKGEVAIFKGQKINPATASYLSALGETEVKVFSSPEILIITTGNEIVQAGNPLQYGQVYESNSTAIITLLKQQSVTDITYKIAKDTNVNLLNKLENSEHYDIVILTGGISVGKYDLVADCLEKIGVQKEFHKIAQKPGKPLYFGTKGKTLFFALPGNPAAVITSYYEYLFPVIRKMMRYKNIELKKENLTLLNDVKIKANRSNFLKGKIEGNGVTILSGQASHILSSFAIADCFIYLPKGKENWKKRESVEVHILPE